MTFSSTIFPFRLFLKYSKRYNFPSGNALVFWNEVSQIVGKIKLVPLTNLMERNEWETAATALNNSGHLMAAFDVESTGGRSVHIEISKRAEQ